MAFGSDFVLGLLFWDFALRFLGIESVIRDFFVFLTFFTFLDFFILRYPRKSHEVAIFS